MSEAPKEIYWTPVSLSAKHDVGVDAIGFAWRTDREDRVAYILKTEAQAATEKAVADALREVARKLRADIDACCFGEFDDEGEKGLRRGMYASLHTIKSLIPPEQQEGETS